LILGRFDEYLHSIFVEIINNYSQGKANKYEMHYLAGGLYKVLINWMDNGLEESDEEMAKIICLILNK